MFKRLLALLRAAKPENGDFELIEPDQLWVPGKAHRGKSLRAGTQLVRIFDSASARGRYSPLDFNPNPVDPDVPANRGRFSSTKSVRYAYMYAADGPKALQTAIWETIAFNGIARRTDGKYLLPSRIFFGRAIQEMETTKKLYVVHIRDAKDAWHFRASIAALQGSDQRATRKWAHYIRRVVPEAHGLRYRSHKYGGNDALVLFEDLPHITKSNRSKERKVKATAVPIPLTGRRGKQLVRDAMAPIGIEFQ
jgi:hypothetical protein